MNLLNQTLIKKLPRLYATEYTPLEDKVAVAKFFHPCSNWTWYVIEFDGKDLCWGLVSGYATEFGYFSLSELNQVETPLGVPIERDIFFRPTRLAELAAFGQGGAAY